MNFITRLTKSHKQHDSNWVIVNRMKKSAHFLTVKTTHLAEDYAKLYIQDRGSHRDGKSSLSSNIPYFR